VPSALVLSNEHRRVFLSTLIVLITGPAVRHAQTDPCILFAFLNLLRGWLLVPKQAHLTNKELLVLLQRVAQVDRLQAIPAALKPAWDAQFLDLLYTVITTKKEDDFGKEVFLRVERTFCCGLQSSDPAVRQKFFRLYSENVQRDLHERLRYIVQYQDWDFLAHTFWLKHAVALLFDCLHMRDPITLAYNSAHVPPLFNYKESLLFPASTHVSAGTTGGAPQKPSSKQPEPAAAATEGLPGGLGGETAGLQVDDQGPVDAAAQPGQATKVSTPSLGRKVEAAAERTQRQQQGSSGAAAGSQGNQPAPVLDLNLPDGLRSRLSSHLEFLARQTALRSDALVTCLIEQVQTDPLVAHHLWVLLFPIVWTSLQKEQQTGLAKPIINLLGKEHHLRQTYLRPTVGQTLLDGISMSQPQPKIPAEMIKYMGRHFHAWHTAITMLESHVGLFPQDMRCFDAVCDLYRALGEDDMWAGLWQRRAKCEETRTAVALQQHGYIPDAQTMFLEMMSRGVGGELNMVTKSEMVLWHDRYLACCAELNQWDTMFDYAKSTDNGRLQLEAAAKLLDWVHLRQVALPKAQVQDGSPEVTMVKTQLQLAEMSLMEVDKLCKAALNQCVMQWWQMPEASPWSYAPVLHSFQRAVELSESWRVAKEFSMQGGVGSQYQDLKDIADTWKLRTPNEWEPVRWWSDVLTWRNQVYNMTIRQFNQIQAAASALHQMGYRDKAWSVNRLAHVARLHHLPEACVSAITTLYGFNAMEVQEAFVKVQEQAKAYMLRPAEYVHGLNLIASTNMDYFSPPHQAEMICLKAQFHQKLSEPDVAHNTFSEALQLWPLCPDAWVNWGRFCDERFNETKQATWLEFAATCFVQGIRLSGTEARSLVPRLLYLLMLDSQGFKVVGSVLLQSAGDLPAWVWLPWVPQLITSLQRPETPAARRILVAAAQAHPQHIYWHIRPMIPPLKDAAIKAVTAAKEKAAHDRAAAAAEATAAGKADGAASAAGTDTEMAEGSATASASAGAMPAAGSQQPPPTQSTQTPPPARPASPPIEKPMEMIAYEHAKAVVEALTPKQLPALQWLDNLIAELGARFNPRTNERLLAVVHTLLSRTYRFPLPASAEVPEAMRKELAQVCKACGGKDPAATAAATAAADGASWTNWDRYQLEFARDLDPGNAETAPKTLGELTERLKGWRTMMEAMIDDMLPPIAKLEDVASGLVEMPLEEVEMPCSAPPCPDGPDAVYIERISADVEVVRRACASSRRLAFYGSDGQARHFLLSGQQSGGAAAHASEERVSHLLRAANGLMATHPEARRRGLAFTAPRSHALSPAGRISEDDPSSTLYIDAYETYCARYGREPDAPIVAFRAATCNEDGTTSESVLKTRLEAYVEAEQAVTENVFSQYMYKTMVDNSRVMWTFKRQFALSVAMSAVACHALRLTGRAPSKVLVSKARGDITHLELAPVYNDRLQMDICGETVPFRFTRNMSSFIGPHGFEGTMVAAGVAAAQGLQKERQCIASLLALFLRDDILAFAQRRLSARSIAALKLEPRQIEHAVMFNVHHCLLRLAEIGPRDSVAAPHQVVQPPPQAVEGQMQPPPPQQSVLISPQGGFKLLIAKATDPKFLCMMDATWQPWL
jgi:transformation/transcription domain-associated protein